MEAWILLSVFAAFMQNARSALQKHLKGRLTTLGAAYVRFFYAWPFAILYLFVLSDWTGNAIPETNLAFYIYCAAGGLAQILFTVLLLWLFSFRNFAVGTTFSKTETVQVALLGFILLGDELSPLAILAISISVLGVMALSIGQQQISLKGLVTGMRSQSTLVGLLCGAVLGASVVLFRGAALSLENTTPAMAAATALTVAVVIQTVGMGLYLFWRERRTLVDILVHWRWAGLVGLAGVLASIGWFTGFTLQNAAYVRAVGQIELVFTFAASTLIFREKTSALEIAGIALVVLGILLILLTG